MAVTAKLYMALKVAESKAGTGAVAATLLADHLLGAPAGETYNATSSVPATQVASVEDADLSAGAATIDLTALTNGFGDALDGTGLKVQLFYFVSASDNTDTITIVDGATNGYNIFGDAAGQITVPVGGKVLLEFDDALDDIAAGDATIDLSSSDLDATYSFVIVMG